MIMHDAKDAAAKSRIIKSDFLFRFKNADIRVTAVARTTRVTITAFRDETRFCWTSMYVRGEYPFGLKPNQIPKLVPASKPAKMMFTNRMNVRVIE
jgi:hypothetical protein